MIFRILFILPLLAFTVFYSILLFLLAGIVYPINKHKANNLFHYLFELLPLIAAPAPIITRVDIQEYADGVIKKNTRPLKRILCVHISQKNLLFRINPEKAKNIIDEIWIYQKFTELLERLEKENLNKRESFIVDFESLSKNRPSKGGIFKKKRYSFDIKWLNDINFEDYKVKPIKRRDPSKSSTIILKPNDFLQNDIVFYFEPSFNKEVNKFLLQNFERIDAALKEKGMRFFYIPAIINNESETIQEIERYLSYQFPEISLSAKTSKSTWVSELLNKLDYQNYYQNISDFLGLSEIKGPCLIHSIDYDNYIHERRKYEYSTFSFKAESEAELEIEIQRYLELVRIPRAEIFFSLATGDPDDPDDMFGSKGQKISEELVQIIAKIKDRKNEKVLIDSLIFMVRSLKDVKPDLCKSLSDVLFNAINQETKKLSRLKVDGQFRIFLPDFDNIEIVLTPLPKTVFFFFLQNPDGAKLKELYNHREELVKIYSRIGNRTDMDTIRKNIYELTDARSNSINEKCSRIKEAFLSQIDDSIAQNYYITGGRSENKRITLDRSLLEFSQIK